MSSSLLLCLGPQLTSCIVASSLPPPHWLRYLSLHCFTYCANNLSQNGASKSSRRQTETVWLGPCLTASLSHARRKAERIGRA
jgi:hypothetical protein